MHDHHLTPFVGQRYLNLESFKRDGTPVQTPVWFAEEHGVLYVYTLANAGKVKRIRRNPSYPSCPLYHARHSDRTLDGGGSHHRGCHDRSAWACLTAPQIWLDEGDRRPVQSPPAPGTGRHRHSVARVTMCADRRERQWWKRSAVSALAILCPMSCIIRVPFLMSWAANSPFPAGSDVPTQTRIFTESSSFLSISVWRVACAILLHCPLDGARFHRNHGKAGSQTLSAFLSICQTTARADPCFCPYHDDRNHWHLGKRPSHHRSCASPRYHIFLMHRYTMLYCQRVVTTSSCILSVYIIGGLHKFFNFFSTFSTIFIIFK